MTMENKEEIKPPDGIVKNIETRNRIIRGNIADIEKMRGVPGPHRDIIRKLPELSIAILVDTEIFIMGSFPFNGGASIDRLFQKNKCDIQITSYIPHRLFAIEWAMKKGWQ